MGVIHRRGWFVLLVIAGVSLVVACTGEAGEVAEEDTGEGGLPGTYVGDVPESELFVGVALSEQGEVVAYACDGESVSEWFRGSMENGRIAFTSEGGAELEAELTAESASGTLVVDGESLEFTAAPPLGGGGLFRAEGQVAGEDSLTGWIVLPDGRQKGVTAVGGQFFSAPDLFAFTSRASRISIPF